MAKNGGKGGEIGSQKWQKWVPVAKMDINGCKRKLKGG